eukprot:7430793-Ditylum_brightwellii.AAC.1
MGHWGSSKCPQGCNEKTEDAITASNTKKVTALRDNFNNFSMNGTQHFYLEERTLAGTPGGPKTNTTFCIQ